MRKNMMTRYLFIILTVLWSPWINLCWGMDAAEILERVHQRYARGNFEADFVQEAYLKAMDVVDTAHGHLCFGPPGMMRWHYQAPEEYFIISDRNSVWLYRPADRQVMTGRTADYFKDERAADYFTNPKELTGEFILELEPEDSEGENYYILKLTPKTKRPDLTGLDLFISKETFEITRAVTSNAFGDKTTLRFSAYKYDQGLDPSLFKFTVPKGVDVIEFQDDPFR